MYQSSGGLVITFDSAQQAMQAESRLGNKGGIMSLIVTPRSVSSNCGFSLFVESENVEILQIKMSEKKILYKSIYEKKYKEGVTYYEKC